MRPEQKPLKPPIHDTALKLSYMIRVFGLIWAAARGWMVAWGILLIVQGLLPVALVYLTKPLVDGLQAAVGRGTSWASVQPVVVVATSIGGVLLLTELIKACLEWIGTAQSELIQDHITDLVHAKSASVDLAFYETPDFYDHLYRARGDASNRPLALLQSTGSLVQNCITLIAMAAVLIPYGTWLPPALLFSTLPAFYVVVRTSQRYHDWWKNTTPERRRSQYFGVVLTDGWHAGEVRLFGLAGYFQHAYRALRRRLRTERLRLLRDQSLARVGAEGVALLVSAATIAWMVWRAFLGLVTLGDIALFFQAFQRGQGLMRALLTNVGQIYTNGLFLVNLFEFLDLKTRIGDPPSPVPPPSTLNHGIRFHNVTFRYPGTDRVALRDFNLTIPAGRTVAIVGANGAGKTTLLKLLCRLYDPESGHIDIDGIDLRDLSLTQLRRMITVMFQLPVGYQGTARQNISMGNLDAESNVSRIEAAARDAGAHDLIAALPQGYDTLLGKWFAEGTELSAGEWQRVAMARAYLRQSEIIILDEPTSFMDSWAEAEWFERFRTLARGRTAIIITHRLTIAMRADVVHVMRSGQIVESGNHQDLLARRGLYSQSWSAQVESASNSSEIPATPLMNS
ncbi:MAG: multidrug ABC transporter ATP-binding protein [Candidatus Rokubacteria bacterium 13_1_40CM_2_68_8]|nr:MAG: multidrug ABC transporter ATP-binding protein [Candidatus Rokubacteria bacterium 13_1_40CM_2_68_8]